MAGDRVTRVSASDADRGPNAGNVVFSIIRPEFSPPDGISDGFGVFSISPTTGIVTLSSDLLTHVSEFSEVLLTIKAEDQGSVSLSATTVLSIVPIPVPILSFGSRVQVPENTPENSNLTTITCGERGQPSNTLSLSLQGNYSRFFAVDIATSQLSLVRKLDYESLINQSDPFYRLDLICQNQFGLFDRKQIEIEVLNIDDNPFIFSRSYYSALVPENAQAGTTVVQITASDADLPNGTVNYAIVNMDRHFIIGTSSGVISVVSQLDHEEQDSYSLTVRAELSGSAIEVPVNISVLDLNDETPAFIFQPYIINNLTTMNEIGDLVVNVVAEDRDFGENGRITYTLQNNSFFVINETTGAIYVDSTLEPNLELTLVVYATDSGDPELSSSTTVYVFVQPSPEGVRFTRTIYSFVVQEDEPRGALIGQVEAFVVDERNRTLNDGRTYQVSYSVTNGSDASVFTIISTTGEIYLLSSLDFDLSARQYILTVQASHQVSNELNFTDKAIVVIQVSDVNDNPPQFVPAAYAIAIEEFTPVNSSIVVVLAMDIDTTSEVTYSIASDDSGPFQINPQSGVISNQEELLIARDYRFFVMASDGELSSTAIVFISVTRSVSVEPTFTRERYIFNLLESASRGSSVGRVEAVTRGTLSSLEFDHLRFRIVTPDQVAFNGTSQAGDSLFHIDSVSGNISTLTDFEFDAENRTTYIFFVQVYSTIDDMVFDTTTVAVELADANDNSPIFTQPLYTRVIESTLTPGSVILNVSASDRDSTTNSEITYSIEPLSFSFTIDRTSGEISIASSSLATGNYRLNVVATDKGSPPLNGSATVVIAVIPGVPSNLMFTAPVYRFGVPENAAANTLVGRVQAVDSVTNMSLSSITYSTSNLSICLYVSPDDGEIRISCSLDRETEPRYEIQVLARERDALGYGTVIVDVLDINDNAPRFSLDVYAEVIDDQYGNTTAILEVNARDTDHGQNSSVRYTLTPTMGGAFNLFRIDESSGAIFLRETSISIGDYRLTVQATDGGVPVAMSSTALVLICVTRARPSIFSFNTSATLFIEENQPPLTTVGRAVLLTTGGEINPIEFMDNLHFSIVGGDSSDGMNDSFPLFDIDPNTGRIFSLRSLDRETADRHVIVVLANFTQFGLAEQASLSIVVTDQNDVRPTFRPMQYSTTIEENTENNGVVINVTVSDMDIGLNGEIELSTNGQSSSPFGIRVQDVRYPNTYGSIFVQNSDLLIPGQYDFEVTALDRGRTPQSGTAQIYITVVHSPPEFLSFPPNPYVFEFTEDILRDAFVGTVSIEQPISPALEGLVYRIVGGNGVGYFAIEGSSGNITNLRSIDREETPQLNLTIMAQVISQPSLAPTMTTAVINIGDINDNVPMFTSGSYSTTILDSELSTGIPLLRVIVTDADVGPNGAFTLSLEYTSPPGLPNSFYITPNGDIFTNTTNLNATTYTLQVTATDLGTHPLSSNTIVTITVQLPVPSEIRFLQPGGYVFNITENMRSGQYIGEIGLAEVPAHVVQFITFMENSTDFNVVRTVGEVRARIQTVNMYDYETRQSYTFRVEARLHIASRSPPVDIATSAEVMVLIIDENDNPPVFINFPATLSYLENRTREEMVYQIQSSDADSGANAQRVYQIVNVDIRDKFRIDSRTGELYVSAHVDREEQSTYDITIRVADSGSPSRSVQNVISFSLLDVNDNVPRMTNGFAISVRERVQPPIELVMLEGVDPDMGSNGTFQFSEVQTFIGSTSQSPSTPVITIHMNGSMQLVQELDYEETQSYTIHVRIADLGSPPLEFTYTNVTLQVINEPDNVPQFSATAYYNTTLPRFTDGARLAQVLATDGDPGDVITYEIASIIVEGNGGLQPAFRIDTGTGRIYHSGNRNITPEANFTINVVAYDNSAFNLTDTTVVNISVLPERLQFTQAAYSVEVAEDLPGGEVVVRVPLQPLSASSRVRYHFNVVQPAGQTNVFTIEGHGQSETVLRLAIGQGLDRETIDRYTIDVTAERSGEPSITATVSLTVTDINDNPPVFTDPDNSVIRVSESTTSLVTISTVNATDADIGSNRQLQYSFSNPEAAGFPFTIDQSTGVISVTGNLDYERTTSYSITVQVSDSGTPPMVASQVYVIQVINENDQTPRFQAGTYFGEIYAGAAPGDHVLHAQFRVSDADITENEQHQFTFNIFFPMDTSRSDADLYAFEVENEAPYFIRVVTLPDVSTVMDTQLLELRAEVSDGQLKSTVKLFISIFTSSHLITFRLGGVSLGEVLSCVDTNVQSSICGFRDALNQVTRRYVGIDVQFYNTSVQTASDSDTE